MKKHIHNSEKYMDGSKKIGRHYSRRGSLSSEASLDAAEMTVIKTFHKKIYDGYEKRWVKQNMSIIFQLQHRNF